MKHIRKYLFYIMAIAIFGQFITSCVCLEEKTNRRSILFYVAGNNSLSSYAEDNLASLCLGYMPEGGDDDDVLLVYYHTLTSNPYLCRYYKDADGKVVQEMIVTYDMNQNSADASVFSQVLSDAEQAFPADSHGLILWSHGNGWLPEGYYSNPVDKIAGSTEYSTNLDDPYLHLVKSDYVKSFGENNGSEIEITDLAAALKQHYEFIIFDCCLMGGIEVAYELKDKCDYLVFSQTEILAEGFPYDIIMDPLFNTPETERESAMIKISQSYFDLYYYQTGIYQSATISVVKTSALKQLANSCNKIFNNNRDKMEFVDPSEVQGYFRFNKNWFYDIDDYISRIASESEYNSFTSALNNAVIFKAATNYFLNLEITKYSGLSTYIQNPEYEYLNNFYKTLKWNIATGMVE
ncbi:MAG: clostripain-related cysteine peptidase [Bacteroidales bacterium]|nr:clostripain-related cysteine peptidase [Bacteroidales bacterium]